MTRVKNEAYDDTTNSGYYSKDGVKELFHFSGPSFQNKTNVQPCGIEQELDEYYITLANNGVTKLVNDLEWSVLNNVFTGTASKSNYLSFMWLCAPCFTNGGINQLTFTKAEISEASYDGSNFLQIQLYVESGVFATAKFIIK